MIQYRVIDFRCEKKDGKLFVHVFTVRPGMYPAAIGKKKQQHNQ